MNNMKTLTLTILSSLAIFGALTAFSCAIAHAAPSHTYTCTTVYVLGGTVTTCR
jgi:hypothetical protein